MTAELRYQSEVDRITANVAIIATRADYIVRMHTYPGRYSFHSVPLGRKENTSTRTLSGRWALCRLTRPTPSQRKKNRTHRSRHCESTCERLGSENIRSYSTPSRRTAARSGTPPISTGTARWPSAPGTSRRWLSAQTCSPTLLQAQFCRPNKTGKRNELFLAKKFGLTSSVSHRPTRTAFHADPPSMPPRRSMNRWSGSAWTT
ncbi:hypothetical protein BD413DRAFT_562149 [Trametes elegans]|nr:hypothetical protein BD413DRAFT_562149 [Trametes elegans]